MRFRLKFVCLFVFTYYPPTPIKNVWTRPPPPPPPMAQPPQLPQEEKEDFSHPLKHGLRNKFN